MKRMLIRAFEQRKPIEIVYLSTDGAITQRVIWISNVTESSITGYCSLRKQTRTFSIDRILSSRLIPYHNKKSNDYAG
ncbi:hypothetical protein [Pseudalkalibacillus berkeleyi]|uniref:WYL domain-containing protein n=1 Tax=Pseudalkalibacillus berkeleyi TaxID=1069813 RepID=A0ABS9GYD6_9BACL|nr:hypothetical protein [Pseudalkalibacillus berkeleyi]MCF6136766.1 hypothetical protein [Pseudalkalibacillus berkeleyi]